MPRAFAILLFSLVFCGFAVAQTVSVTTATTTTSDPQAVTLAAQAMQALTGGSAIYDVTLSGSATETAGATTSSGPATFTAKGLAESRIDLRGSGLVEVRSQDSSGQTAGQWITSDGAVHEMATHNTWTEAGWFFPAFSSLATASQSNMIAKYVGFGQRNGVAVQHLRFSRVPQSSISGWASMYSQAAVTDIYLDPVTFLPVALAFQAHSNDDAGTNIPEEIDFGNYQQVAGANVPLHVQKLLQGSVVLDFQATQAQINTGVPDSLFTVQTGGAQ